MGKMGREAFLVLPFLSANHKLTPSLCSLLFSPSPLATPPLIYTKHQHRFHRCSAVDCLQDAGIQSHPPKRNSQAKRTTSSLLPQLLFPPPSF